MLLDRNTLSSRRGVGRGEEGFVNGCLIKRTRAILGKVELSPILKKTNLGMFLKKCILVKTGTSVKNLIPRSTHVWKYGIRR